MLIDRVRLLSSLQLHAVFPFVDDASSRFKFQRHTGRGTAR